MLKQNKCFTPLDLKKEQLSPLITNFNLMMYYHKRIFSFFLFTSFSFPWTKSSPQPGRYSDIYGTSVTLYKVRGRRIVVSIYTCPSAYTAYTPETDKMTSLSHVTPGLYKRTDSSVYADIVF